MDALRQLANIFEKATERRTNQVKTVAAPEPLPPQAPPSPPPQPAPTPAQPPVTTATEPSPKCILNTPIPTAEDLEAGNEYFTTFLADDCPAFDSVEQTLLDVASDTCYAETEFPMEECTPPSEKQPSR